MTKMMESFHNSNKSYFKGIRLAMISKQGITKNLGGFISANSFHLSNKEKDQKTNPKQFHSNITITLRSLTSCSCSILMLGFAFTSSNMGFKFFIRRMSKPKICAQQAACYFPSTYGVLPENAMVIQISTFG